MKKIVSLFLCFVFCFTIFLPCRPTAHADALTASAIAASAFAIGNTIGATWTFRNQSTSQVWNGVMSAEVETYCGSRSLSETFGDQIVKDVAGRIVVGHVTYNRILDFLDWLKTKYTLNWDQGRNMGNFINGQYYAFNQNAPELLNGWTLAVYTIESSPYWNREWRGPEGETRPTSYNDVNYTTYPVYSTEYKVINNAIRAVTTFQNAKGGIQVRNDDIGLSVIYPGESITHPKGYIAGDPTTMPILSPGKAWAGDIKSYEGPDTNLDQLMQGIFEGVADTNLDVEGEIIDVDPPQPVPTPAPGIDEIIGGLDDANDTLTGIDTNLDDLYAQGLEEIGTIGEARDAITDAVSDQTGVLEGAIADNAGVVSGAIDQAVSDVGTAIGTQTGVISGAIDQAVTDVQTAIGEQTAALDESLSATAEGVQTIVEAIEDEAINWRKFDLKGLFPFCIPFDIYNMLKALDASPVAPHVQLPFVIESIGFSYNLDLDFSAFDSVAAILRQMELICYGLALAWATSKVIKW